MMKSSVTIERPPDDEEDDEDDAQAALLAELEALEELGRPTHESP
jgi:hypothetical protein